MPTTGGNLSLIAYPVMWIAAASTMSGPSNFAAPSTALRSVLVAAKSGPPLPASRRLRRR